MSAGKIASNVYRLAKYFWLGLSKCYVFHSPTQWWAQKVKCFALHTVKWRSKVNSLKWQEVSSKQQMFTSHTCTSNCWKRPTTCSLALFLNSVAFTIWPFRGNQTKAMCTGDWAILWSITRTHTFSPGFARTQMDMIPLRANGFSHRTDNVL